MRCVNNEEVAWRFSNAPYFSAFCILNFLELKIQAKTPTKKQDKKEARDWLDQIDQSGIFDAYHIVPLDNSVETPPCKFPHHVSQHITL